MSKLIVEMEMPENCRSCPFSSDCSFCEGYDDYCVLAPKDAKYEWNFSDGKEPKERPSWCPIKGELPDEHGDLIDRDELRKYGMMYRDGIDEGGLIYVPLRDVMKSISNAPTIIAAERKDDGK